MAGADDLRAEGAGEERDTNRAKLKTVLHAKLIASLMPEKLAITTEDQKEIEENFARLKRISECGHYPAVVTMKRHSIMQISRARCKHPLCPLCTDAKAANHRERYTPVVQAYRDEGVKFSLITLTLPHSSDDEVGVLLGWLFEAMRIFTRSAAFKRYVSGYIRGVEITNRNSNGYHPHAHFVIGGHYWPLKSMIKAWRTAVRNVSGRNVADNGVDVLGLTDVERGLVEAVGYPVKLAALGEFTREQIRALDAAVYKRHIVQPSGDWGKRATRIEEQERERLEFAMSMMGVRRIGYVSLIKGIKRGDERAQKAALELLWQLLEDGSYPAACGVIGINLARYAPRWIRDQLPGIYLRGA